VRDLRADDAASVPSERFQSPTWFEPHKDELAVPVRSRGRGQIDDRATGGQVIH
jgi:hypothetical protein